MLNSKNAESSLVCSGVSRRGGKGVTCPGRHALGAQKRKKNMSQIIFVQGGGGKGGVAAKNKTIKQNMIMARTKISILIVFRSPHVIKKSKLNVIRHSGKYSFRSEAITDPIEICRQWLRPHQKHVKQDRNKT